MSIRGRLIADFESFYTAVDKAEVKIKSFESGSADATRQLNRLADSFSGRKVIQQATLTSEAIERIGGVSKLSTADAARGLRDIEQGFERMLKSGEPIPTSMMKTAAELRNVGRASELADASINKISQSYRQFDGILQSLGINIGPYVKGLEDITNLATKGAAGLGTFGAAAAVVGTAVGSWKVGTWIGEQSGLTKAIADGTAVLRGYGDVAQETALAVADAADLAGKAEINFKRQAEGTKAAAKAAQEHAEEMRREGMVALGNEGQFASLQQQLDALREKRLADAKAAFAASQAQSIFGEKTEETTAKIDRQISALEAREASLQKIATEEAARKKAVDDFMNAPTLNDRPMESFSSDIGPLTQTQLQKIGTMDSTGGYSSQFDERNVWRRLDALSAKEGNYHNIKSLKDYSAMMREVIELAQLRMWAQGKERPPGFAAGVKNYRGGPALVGERGPEIVDLPGGSDVIPNHAIGGTVVHLGGVHFHGTTVGASYDFQRMVKAALEELMARAGVNARMA